MTQADQFIQFLADLVRDFNIWFLVKILFLIGLTIYLAFAVIVIRQVGLMSKTVNGPLETPIKSIAWIHLLVAIGVFLLALAML